MSALSLGVLLGSTRPGRIGKAVAKWVVEKSTDRGGARIRSWSIERIAIFRFSMNRIRPVSANRQRRIPSAR